VPLNISNVLCFEDTEPVRVWEAMIREVLNGESANGCFDSSLSQEVHYWLNPFFDTFLEIINCWFSSQMEKYICWLTEKATLVKRWIQQ
jgi:hypothetical protein